MYLEPCAGLCVVDAVVADHVQNRGMTVDDDERRIGIGRDAAAIRASIIELDAVVGGGMVSTTGSGGGPTLEVDDRADVLVENADEIRPRERPTLEGLAGTFGVLPFEQAVTSTNRRPHRYSWYCLEVEKGARSVTFTLVHGAPAMVWMYLIDPRGNEVSPASEGVVAWGTGRECCESVTIARPAGGHWLVVGVRLDRGGRLPSSAVAAIDHCEVAVFGDARRHGEGGPVEFRAGARYVEPLTELSVTARVRGAGGPWHEVRLRDDHGDGVHRGATDLPEDVGTGFIEIRAPELPLIAHGRGTNLPGAVRDISGVARAPTSGFVRQVPISVVSAAIEVPARRPVPALVGV